MAIQRPKRKELPIAEPDVAGILYHCWYENTAIDEAVKECRSAGASFVTADQVGDKYKDLDHLFRTMHLFFESLRKQVAKGNETDQGEEQPT